MRTEGILAVSSSGDWYGYEGCPISSCQAALAQWRCMRVRSISSWDMALVMLAGTGNYCHESNKLS